MRIRKSIIFMSLLYLCVIGIISLLLFTEKAISGPYLNSAHGKSTYGVDRTSLSSFGYSKGNCAHCHEQHASIGGTEPNPTGGPSKYALFYTNHVSQTDNVCFKCHTDLSSLQTGGLTNRSYSYRAGGYAADLLNDIREAFSFALSATSHNLGNIQTFINGRWGYTNDSNPCAACHNPHMALGDPANAPNSRKTTGTRGYSPVSRPSLHSKDNNAWGLWGDAAAERMNSYALSLGGIYQAPNATSGYEPDGSATQDGSNLADFNTFCIDCHNNTNTTISSTPLGRFVYAFNWGIEKHGGGAASDYGGENDHVLPYQDTLCGQYVLACTDCHEPHGSPNKFLIRKQVNKSMVTIPSDRGDWKSLCDRCHTSIPNKHHILGFDCLSCHVLEWDPTLGAWIMKYRECIVCHYHGSTKIYNATTGNYEIYNGGEHLF